MMETVGTGNTEVRTPEEIFLEVSKTSLPELFRVAIQMHVLEKMDWLAIRTKLRLTSKEVGEIKQAEKELIEDLRKNGIPQPDLYNLLVKTHPDDGTVDL